MENTNQKQKKKKIMIKSNYSIKKKKKINGGNTQCWNSNKTNVINYCHVCKKTVIGKTKGKNLEMTVDLSPVK